MKECPRCGSSLSSYSLSDVQAYGCDSCGWVGVPVDHQSEPKRLESWQDAIQRFQKKFAADGLEEHAERLERVEQARRDAVRDETEADAPESEPADDPDDEAPAADEESVTEEEADETAVESEDATDDETTEDEDSETAAADDETSGDDSDETASADDDAAESDADGEADDPDEPVDDPTEEEAEVAADGAGQ